MAAHRYWRVRVVAQAEPNPSNVALSEVEMHTSIGGANVVSGGTVIFSTEDATGGAARAFNGNTASTDYWRCVSNDAAPWVGYDFGAGNAQDIVEIVVATGGDHIVRIPKRAYLEFSDNGSAWTTLLPALTFDTSALTTGNTFNGFTVLVLAAPRVVGAKLRMDINWPNPTQLVHRVVGRKAAARYDGVDGGAYRIVGTTKIKGTPNAPVSRRVQLFVHAGTRVIRETWSDPVTGAYEFKLLKNQPYFVLAFDHTQNYRAVVADQVTPEVMP